MKQKKRHHRDDIRMRVKTSPRLHWVLPYLKRAKAKMPGLILPTQIRSFKPTKRKTMRVLGNIYFETRIIVLATHTQQTHAVRGGRAKKKIISLPKNEILDTLAHELAHMKYPEHDYEHEEYTSTIYKTFGLTQKCPRCKGTGRVSLTSKP